MSPPETGSLPTKAPYLFRGRGLKTLYFPYMATFGQYPLFQVSSRYQHDHLSRIGENVSYNVLDATHLLYQAEIDKIVTLTNEFFAETKN